QWSDRRATYRDKSGQLKTKLVRPEYLDGDIWKRGRGPNPWPLYREDDIQSGDVLFFVGGETCVETLRSFGFSATCNQGGECTYLDKTAERLAQLPFCSLVIWPDHDPTGYQAAEQLFERCRKRHIPAAILNPLDLYPEAPQKWDVADWDISINEAQERLKAVVATLHFEMSTVSQPSQHKKPALAQQYQAVEDIWSHHLRFNELTNQIEFDGDGVEDAADLRLSLALDHNIDIPGANCDLIIKRLAKQNSYHPVKDYLEICEKTYGTSTEILSGIAYRYFGCPEPIYQTFLTKTLVAAVARIFEPGCKVDTALILQGPQGYRKSSFFRTLAGNTWFDDSMGAAMNERDERLKLHQFWFLEWGEMESFLKKKDISGVKAFLSCPVDTVRPPYGRQAIRLKRRSIIVGSTNQCEFLSDATGNRRFWVVPVHHRIDLELLQQERDQIWAAAIALYRSGSPVFLSEEEEAIATECNESYQNEDPWLGRIMNYLRDNHIDEVTIAELLSQALEIEVGNQSKRDEMRVSDVLKSISWTSTRKSFRGIRRRVWVSPAYDSTFEVGHPTQPPNEVEHRAGQTHKSLETSHSAHRDNVANSNTQNTKTVERNGHPLTTSIPPPPRQDEQTAFLDKDNTDEIERRDSNGT
ncbi:MAG: VapE domain-containing protein, partial [Cyanobacteria bacterium P01_A01_bin.37]